ncbi:MAG: type III pantothenate kinase [Sphingobacteriales bacterium]|nr:MAG: type III pantothenate kinase [Sphingobacteriales bacterium]
MANFLCIDAGNTALKSALYQDAGSARPLAFERTEGLLPSEPFIRQLLDHGKIRGAILCSVIADSTPIETLLRELHIPLLKLTPQTNVPLINAYRSSDTLGPDRLALAVAVAEQFPKADCLAVSAGTCITYNFVATNNAFRGGSISPGLSMRLRAMHQFTAKLPEVALDDRAPLLGYDTESALQSGALIGAAAEIDGMVDRYGERFPNGFNAVLTGGDADALLPHLKSRIFADPFLLLKGLHRILRHNAHSLSL